MRVDMDKRDIDSYEKIAKEANRAVQKKTKFKFAAARYRKAITAKNLSVELKKKNLIKHLHGLIINAFSIDIGSFNKKKNSLIMHKQSLKPIRDIIYKLKSINNYLEEVFLVELGALKGPLLVNAIKSKKPEKYIERSGRPLTKGYFNKIEHAVCKLIEEIIFFDKKLLKDYGHKEVRITSTEKVEIKDLRRVLAVQSELFDALEAKIPPDKMVKAKLFSREIFNRWAPAVFALLSSIEAEHGKEQLIFTKIKKNYKLRSKIENKIVHIIDEKENMLKLREKRALAMKSFEVSDDYRQSFHEYVSAASL
jgi:hypothetical protein